MAMKQAMSLSKLFWAPKEKIGSNEALYNEFDAQYVEPIQEEVTEASTENVEEVATTPKKARAPKKTEEEKAIATAEKAEAAAAKKAAAQAAKPPKEEKAPKAPKAAVAAPIASPKKSPAKKVEAEFSCPNDGNVYTFTYKGKNYLRNYDGMMWEKGADRNPGSWAGMWKNGAIDDSVAEPEYDEE
jgi:outer membrane biosynthesis protein TonB